MIVIMNRLKDLKRLCPVPIHFMDIMTHPQFAGAYYDIGNHSGKPHIEIDNSLTGSQKITTLIHEIGHALCDSKDCKCMSNPDHTEREIHANKFVLRRLMKYGLKKELREEMERIEQQAYGGALYAYYECAAKHTIKLKLWQKCSDYVV